VRLILLSIAAAIITGFALVESRPSVATPVADRAGPVAGCAAAGCHGGGEVGRAFSEQSTWAAGDPHAKAYRILFNEESQRISRNLKRPMPAHEDRSCLACHTTGGEHCMTNFASDGVGCDACHGPSRDWIAKHYEPSWKFLTDTQKATLGFIKTKSLVSRMMACVGCHVGDATREVDHDLIAAGHPRLAFESARFHYRPGYKKHWVEKQPERDFEVRAWLTGQYASLRNAVALSQHHFAEHSPRKIVDFSEQSCFACHKSLKPDGGGASGVAPWQVWHTAVLATIEPHVSAIVPGLPPMDVEKITALKTELDKNAPQSVTSTSAAALKAIDDRLAALQAREQITAPIPAAALRALAKSLAGSGARVCADWDAAAVHFLALAALHHADPALFSDATATLEQLKSHLQYKPGYNGPTDYKPAAARELFAHLESLR
jgi:hypothetical protein